MPHHGEGVGAALELCDYLLAPSNSGSLARADEILPGVADQVLINQTLLDLVADGRGKLGLLSGDIALAAPILIQNMVDVLLSGAGWETKLVTVGVDTIAILIGDRVNAALASQNIVVRDLYIDGTSQTTETVTPETNDRRTGIEMASPARQTDNILIDTCFLYNTGSDSIYGYLAGHITVKNCTVDETRGYWASIHFHGPYNEGILIYNRITNSATSGIRHGYIIAKNYLSDVGKGGETDGREAGILGGATGMGAIIDNNVVEMTAAGSLIGIKSFGSRDMIIGNAIDAGGANNYLVKVVAGDEGVVVAFNKGYDDRYGILVEDTNGAIIIGNTLDRTRRDGIILRGSQNCIVKGNTLLRIGNETGNTYDAIRLETLNGTYSTRNIIEGNQIYSDLANQPQYGINEVDANQDYNIIQGNSIENVATSAYNKNGPFTKLEGVIERNIGAPPGVTDWNRGCLVYDTGLANLYLVTPAGVVVGPL